ncbi:MAG: flavin reductase family protein [Anaerolineae bacterium]|nr:flavin reductase family protein [Anaerolineae bacterium]
MIAINPVDLPPRDAYRLMTSVIVPRPIAWVSTIGNDGSRNLAPFSFFNGIGGNPPTLMISVGLRKGQPKDTLRNVQENGEFVVNMVSEDLGPQMNLTAGEYDYEVDEFALAGLTAAPCDLVKPPRVAEAGVAMECRASQLVQVTDTTYTVIFGRILRFHIREGLLRPDGLIDANALRPLARLGGDQYATLSPTFDMPRPS